MVSPRFLQPILIPVLLSFYGMNVNVSLAQAGEQNANQNIAQNSSSPPSEQPKKSKPRVVFFEESQSFLSDALNGTADPLSGSGASVNRLNAAAAEGLAINAQKASENVTVTGTFKLDISPALQTAINNNTVGNFIGDGGSLTLRGDDGNSYKVNVNRTAQGTGTLSIGNTTIGINIDNSLFSGNVYLPTSVDPKTGIVSIYRTSDLYPNYTYSPPGLYPQGIPTPTGVLYLSPIGASPTGATISGDPQKGIVQGNTGTLGTITINGQTAVIRAGLTGNNAVLQFIGPGGQTFEIRLDNVAGYTQADLNKLTFDSTIRGALTFGRMPDR